VHSKGRLRKAAERLLLRKKKNKNNKKKKNQKAEIQKPSQPNTVKCISTKPNQLFPTLKLQRWPQ
jgi:hypothetical protein